MKSQKATKTTTEKAVQAVIQALVAKKEIKSRFQNGEDLRKVSKEKGLEIVLPL